MKKNKDNDKIFESFTKGEQETVRNILHAASVSPDKTVVTSDETELALMNVRKNLGLDAAGGNTFRKRNSSNFGQSSLWTVLLSVAAVVVAFFVYTSFYSATTVTAPNGEQLVYVLPDGTNIKLNSGTTLEYRASFGRSSRSISLSGEALFDVVSNDIPFYVHTDLGSVLVTGTKFQVRYWPEDERTTVMLDEGSVDFFATANPAAVVRLQAGEASHIAKSSMRPETPETFNRQAAFAWQENNFAYQNAPIRSILRDLERRFNTSIYVEETVLLDGTLSTFYSGTIQLETVLQDICTVKGLSFSKTANGFHIHAP